jgi:tRNA(fMet)-specific endonuclease VapC
MNVLLDSNVCIALLNERPAQVRRRFEEAVEAGQAVFVPTVVAFKLWFGAHASIRRGLNVARLESFLGGVTELLPFDDADARAAGEVRANLRTAGNPIGPYDVLIAGQALNRGLTLVTANVREFRRVAGLRWEDWAAE